MSAVIRNDIRKRRFEHGEMTQEALAKRVGVTRQTIISIEAAKYVPSLELALRIARVFNSSVENVLHYSPVGSSQR